MKYFGNGSDENLDNGEGDKLLGKGGDDTLQGVKAHREMISAVRRGDRVVTGGGMIGQVVKVINDAEVDVKIAEGVKERMIKSTITDVIARGEPIKGAKKGEAAEAEEELDEDAPALPPPSTEPGKRGGGFGGLLGPKK